MKEKKIEPTEAMVEAGASYAWEETNPGILGWNSISERHKEGCRRDARAVLAASLNHPDAAGLFADEDDRPWEPLGESDPARVGDEVKWDYYGLTMTATVARVDKTGSLYTAAGLHIGVRSVGTWHVRRAVRELPTEGGIVIVANDGHDDIEAIGPVSGATWRTKEAVLGADGRWYGVWRLDARTPAAASAAPEHITLDTCKVDDR